MTAPHNAPATAPVVQKGRVLMTGMHGFTGRYLAQTLRDAGYVVLGLVQQQASTEDECMVDLTDRMATAAAVEWAAPDYVVHLAAIAFVDHRNVDQLYRTNIVGTHNLLEALSEHTIQSRLRSVLLASSANVYGNSLVEPITEQVAPAPANDYAVSKLAMEHMARLWFGRLPITLVRPFNYTGVGQSERFLLPKIVGHYRRNASQIELGNVDVARDFSDVRDVVRVYQALLEQNFAGETFNICSGRTYSLADALAMMAQIAGYALEVRVNPDFVRANEVKRLVGSSVYLEQQIGPISRISLEDTLRWMWQA